MAGSLSGAARPRSGILSSPEPSQGGGFIDLHVHTTASDGSLSPSACVDEAARVGLAAIGITDHDTLAGNPEALARGRETGVEVVPGIEISCDCDHVTLHLLGYYPEPDAPELDALVAEVQESRRERNPQILRRLAELGCEIDPEELAAEAGSEVVGRPHIAALLVRRGYVRSMQEAFDYYLGKGAAAYVARRKVEPARTITAFLRARAVPVLAHPGSTGARSAADVEPLVRRLVEMGLRGLEAYYHAHDPGQVAAYRRLAARCGLLVTGGSDFHGAVKPDIQMGRGKGDMAVPYGLLEGLKAERERLEAGCPRPAWSPC